MGLGLTCPRGMAIVGSKLARGHDDLVSWPPDGHDVRCSGGKPMTFEQCHANLMVIRRSQGTRCPVVKIAYNGMVPTRVA